MTRLGKRVATHLVCLVIGIFIGMAVLYAQLLSVEPVAMVESRQEVQKELDKIQIPDIEVQKEEEPPRYGFTEDEIFLLTQLLCGDYRNDGDGEYDFDFIDFPDFREVSKVIGVVMNRVWDPAFPDTVTEVILQEGQFLVMPRNLDATPGMRALGYIGAWCKLYDEDNPLARAYLPPVDHLYFSGDGERNYTSTTWFR